MMHHKYTMTSPYEEACSHIKDDVITQIQSKAKIQSKFHHKIRFCLRVVTRLTLIKQITASVFAQEKVCETSCDLSQRVRRHSPSVALTEVDEGRRPGPGARSSSTDRPFIINLSCMRRLQTHCLHAAMYFVRVDSLGETHTRLLTPFLFQC